MTDLSNTPAAGTQQAATTRSKAARLTLAGRGDKTVQQTTPADAAAKPEETAAVLPQAAATDSAPVAETAAATDTVAPAQTKVEEPKPAVDMLLARILSTRRRHSSTGDSNFRIWLHAHLKTIPHAKVTLHKEGNILVAVGDKPGTTVFSCHVDTVHSLAESNENKQQALNFDPAFGHIFLADKQGSGCLGGDDGCGIFIMLKMIEAKKQGWYLFHTGEEVGAIGSRAFKLHEAKFLENIEAVVAFDRAFKEANPEVIHTQGGQRCASNEYVEALVDKLNNPAFGFDDKWVTSGKGSFTDSKTYATDVPECINLTCFYDNAHSSNEYVQYFELLKLVDAAIAIDWADLPIKRNPFVKPATPQQQFGGYKQGGQGRAPLFGMEDEDEDIENFFRQQARKGADTAAPATPPVSLVADMNADEIVEDMANWPKDNYVEFVNEEPDMVVKVLMTLMAENSALLAKVDLMKTMLD